MLEVERRMGGGVIERRRGGGVRGGGREKVTEWREALSGRRVRVKGRGERRGERRGGGVGGGAGRRRHLRMAYTAKAARAARATAARQMAAISPSVRASTTSL